MKKKKENNKKLNNQIAIFKGKEIRKTIYQKEWHFSVVDIVKVLTDSANSTDYLKKLRKRDKELGFYIGTNCPQLEMTTETGKKRKILAGNVEQLFRIIQSIPSPKAEPFKRWLAKVGYERIYPIRYEIIKRGKEIEDPELAANRAREIYRAKGYSEGWIHLIRYFVNNILSCTISIYCKA